MEKNYWCHRLKKWRVQMGLSQKQIAKLSGLTQSGISHLEKGRRGFTQATLDKLLKIYKKDYCDLFCTIDYALLKSYLLDTKRKNDRPMIDPAELRKIPPEIIQKI
jgi:transcriptional regulator with XRE-family HTH domain